MAEVVPHVDWRQVMPNAELQNPADEQILRDYFWRFAWTGPNGRERTCVNCYRPIAFEWGLAHGAGRCIHCGWPIRGYHFPKLTDGKELRITEFLCYHPDYVTTKEKKF